MRWRDRQWWRLVTSCNELVQRTRGCVVHHPRPQGGHGVAHSTVATAPACASLPFPQTGIPCTVIALFSSVCVSLFWGATPLPLEPRSFALRWLPTQPYETCLCPDPCCCSGILETKTKLLFRLFLWPHPRAFPQLSEIARAAVLQSPRPPIVAHTHCATAHMGEYAVVRPLHWCRGLQSAAAVSAAAWQRTQETRCL